MSFNVVTACSSTVHTCTLITTIPATASLSINSGIGKYKQEHGNKIREESFHLQTT